MYKVITDGLKFSSSFSVSCRNLEQELIGLSSSNKKDFFHCFNSATLSLGHQVPLSFALFLIPSLERAVFPWTRFGQYPFFSQNEYKSLSSWKSVCENVATGKILRQRRDGRFGSEKILPKPKKTIKADVKFTMLHKISKIKFKRENRKTALSRVAKIFNNDTEIITTDLLVNLLCPLGLTRIRIPGRTKNCEHISCFDIENFARMAEIKEDFKIKCPECKSKRKWNVADLLVDPIFEDILDNTSITTKKVRLFKNGKWEAIEEKKEEEESESESEEFLLKEIFDSSSSLFRTEREYIDLT